jgi:hypothetical protein
MDASASLEWTLVTPYKLEMARVCRQCRRGGGGVHGFTEEAKDER